jgi:elongation factor P
MLLASQLRAGMAIRYEAQSYKVLAADYHPGQGRMGGQCHARLRNLDTGTLWEHSFRSEMKLEEIPLSKQPLEFLYTDAENCAFMHPETYEQVEVPKALIGAQAPFLEAGMKLAVEFAGARPVSVLMPDVLEVRIADTAPPTHQQQDSTLKTAKLENGVAVMVPQFVKTGDLIRIDLATLKYIDRARGEGKSRSA